MKLIIVSTICMALMGCANIHNLPTKIDIHSADYGVKVSHVIVEREIPKYLRLKDPYSAKVSCYEGIRGYSTADDRLATTMYGYIYACTINAKNSYGGYTGEESFGVVYNGTKMQLLSGVPGRWGFSE